MLRRASLLLRGAGTFSSPKAGAQVLRYAWLPRPADRVPVRIVPPELIRRRPAR